MGLRRGLKYLLLGAAFNVAVAWVCALWSPFPVGQYTDHADGGRAFWSRVPDSWPQHRTSAGGVRHYLSCNSVRGWGLTVVQVGWNAMHMSDGYPPGPHETFTLHQAGWPLASLECSAHSGARPSPRWNNAVEVPTWLCRQDAFVTTFLGQGAQRRIPLRPRPLGFAANSLLAAAAAFLLVREATSLRSRSRLRRNLCPRCAYPIGQLPVCSECGHPLPAKEAAA